MSDNSKILVGKIVAPQGIHGELRVQTYTEKPIDLKKLQIFGEKILAKDIKFIRLLNPTSTVVIVKINGVDTRNDAEKLRGINLYTERDSLPKLKDNEFYQIDLIGFKVVRDNKILGIVVGFQNFGAGDIIELDNDEMVSFIGANVDVQNKTIIVL